jgi:pyruvate dehydrogenase E1 component
VGTLYDPFISRGLDALNYACYMDARFLLVATPSGVSLAPEGGAHQSIATPLIGMAQDGLASFEPAFADELAIVMEWAFDYLQRDDDKADAADWKREAGGGSVYLRLSTRPLEQPRRPADDIRRGVIDGAYWLRDPGPNCEVVIAYQGAVATEAIAAAAALAEGRRDIGILSITSADRLNAGWQAAQTARVNGRQERSHVEHLLGGCRATASLSR